MLNLAADKAFHLLGWQSKWGFNETLAETVSWYKAVQHLGDGVVPVRTRDQITTYSCVI
jgi:dTDP-D-glucose 4,6-dehydratase